MCMICQKQDDFSLQHLEIEAKKLSHQQLMKKAREVKDSIKKQEIWLIGNRCDGYETKAVQDTLNYLKEVQYILSRKM